MILGYAGWISSLASAAEPGAGLNFRTKDPSAYINQTPGTLASDVPVGNRPRASIVARVDDEIILLEEVMAPLRPRLEQLKKQLPEEKYREAEWMALQQVTKGRIQRLILLKELEATLPNKAALPKIRQSLDGEFEKYLLKLARDAKLKTREEILAKIKEEGADLDSLRDDYIDNMLAQIYLQRAIKPLVKEPTRDELMAYYQENLAEFTEDAGVVWSHIQVKKGSSAADAKTKITQIHQELKSGGDFAKLAQSKSDGPTAAIGGEWQLTSKGSYADTAVDKVLFSIPVGEISDVIEGKEAFHIVRVEKRNDGGPSPFSQVQEKIAERLNNQIMTNLRKTKLEEAAKNHFVESIFDAGLDSVKKPTDTLTR
jgi:parvulin-like peptidyl-prolyl isomerase